MSAPRILSSSVPSSEHDYRLVEVGEEYGNLVVSALSESTLVTSLVCYGALPLTIDVEAEVDESKLGQGLIISYVTCAYNAATKAYPDEFKAIEHCMFRTTSSQGHILDFDDRVWDNNSAGAYMTLVSGRERRDSIINTTNQILSENEVQPLHRAFLDVMLIPLVQAWPGSNLNCEAIIYISHTFKELITQIVHEDLKIIKNALRKVSGIVDEFINNVICIIQVEMGMSIPKYMSTVGVAYEYASIVRKDWEDKQLLECRAYKLLIHLVDDFQRSGLLISSFLDAYLEWGGENGELEDFSNYLEEHDEVPEPINLNEIPHHRAVCKDIICGVSSITEEVQIRGGKLKPVEHGEISTKDFRGRQVGSIDGRRIVAYFEDDGKLVVQFKNARNYFLNVLYFVRPNQLVNTEMREQIIDRDRIVGIAALHLLFRGRISARLARFIVAALTFNGVSIKKTIPDSGISGLLGKVDGSLEYNGTVSPSILAVFPVLFDRNYRLFIYHEEQTYRLKLHSMAWYISREEMNEEPVGFGNLSTGYPLKQGNVVDHSER